jgi:hypothetical protein
MRAPSARYSILALWLSVALGACGSDQVTKPENRPPVILSLGIFPAAIGLSDSAIVVCNATDPDADTLVYDWFTDARLTIKGARPGESFLYNTDNNSNVFYPRLTTPPDTALIDCVARDQRGRSAHATVRLIIHQ